MVQSSLRLGASLCVASMNMAVRYMVSDVPDSFASLRTSSTAISVSTILILPSGVFAPLTLNILSFLFLFVRPTLSVTTSAALPPMFTAAFPTALPTFVTVPTVICTGLKDHHSSLPPKCLSKLSSSSWFCEPFPSITDSVPLRASGYLRSM